MRSAVAFAVLFAGCQWFGVAPEPLRGPPPQRILIAPPQSPRGEAAAAALLANGLEAALRGRGYAVLPYATGADLLAKHRLLPAALGDDPAALPELRQVTGADAVLRLDVRHFAADQDRLLERASYDFGWQLVGLDGAELWSFALRGDYVRPQEQRPLPPQREVGDPMPPLRTADQPQPFRDAAELVAALHKAAMARLPEAP